MKMQNESVDVRETRRQALLREINAAKSDIETAQTNFDCVSGSDEVDVCIYRLRAAETRYGALLKSLKELSAQG